MSKENEVKHCVIVEENICDNCGFCDTCEFDSSKICDNCMRCIGLAEDSEADYLGILIDRVEGYEEYRKHKK